LIVYFNSELDKDTDLKLNTRKISKYLNESTLDIKNLPHKHEKLWTEPHKEKKLEARPQKEK